MDGRGTERWKGRKRHGRGIEVSKRRVQQHLPLPGDCRGTRERVEQIVRLHLRCDTLPTWLRLQFAEGLREQADTLDSAITTETVMLATLKNKSARVAVKVIKKRPMKEHRIVEERNVLKMAGECPFLCPGLAAFQTPAHAFFVMPHVSGGNLSDILKKEHCLDRHKVKFMSAEMVCGIQFLHRHGIIHRDLKPDNILFERNGHVKIADFGVVATNIFAGETTTGVIGSRIYMAPEVILNQAYGPAADWWSFGSVNYEMLSGRHPFFTGQEKELYNDCVTTMEPRYPRSFAAVTHDFLSKLLTKDQKVRLGVNGDIRGHPFYSGIDWKNLEAKKIPPPYQPRVESYGDLTSECREESLSFLNDSNTSEYTENIPGLSFTSHKWRD